MAVQQAAAERPAADRVFGIVGGALVMLGLVFLVRSFADGGSDTGARAPAPVPALAIVSPTPGAEIGQPVVVELDAGTRLVPGPSGWTADGRHLHLFVGGTELMAASTEIQNVGGTRYRWTLPRLPAGPTTLRLAWSGESHRTLDQGATPTIPVRLR